MDDPGPGPAGPTVASAPGDLAYVLRRNIERLRERREEEARRASLSDKVAERITDFTGSMPFVFIHLAIFGAWIVVNLAGPEAMRFDPTFVALAMVASVEAIFLSTFVLISQNRMQAQADKRADLDLQISLLAEHEVTKLVTMVSALTNHFGIRTDADDELHEITQDVAPDAVLDEIEATRPEG